MPQVLCMDPVEVDIPAKRKKQQELRSYLDSQVASKLSLKATREANFKPFLEYQTATLRAGAASEQARLEFLADQKKAYKQDLDRQAEEDRRRREMAKAKERMGTTTSSSVNAFTGRELPFDLVPTPQMGTLGVKIGYAVVPKTRTHKHTREY
uniref:Uncharacterized protein n=2 Tax=Dunaliella tertiolecta TaxID=3047 RepID=A0A7S3R9E2_DUNTE|mmetsp:Transcript_23597/g.65013  ORF Transcript_23597/g.65013 Transcript_23597/m.65013 type:complete len:153 (+) Transcript_23597:303-761(+)